MMVNKTCRLVTLGCKVNQYETQLVQEALEQIGFREASDGESADLCVVNTCTVTSTGDSKSRQVIRKLARQNPGTRTIVMGCYATRDPHTVSRLPSVYEVVTDKRELPDVLGRVGVVDIPAGISRFEGRRRAYVKVQDGCILKCSFCIIPTVRPGLRSREPEHIEQEVRRLIDSGHKEVVICGIHVGHYGVDTTRGKSGRAPFRLWHLFERLDRIPGAWRMRLSSIEAAEINDDFIAAASDSEHLCPQFHPALQSGSDSVLRRMRRRYSVERFLEKLSRIRDRIPGASFATDMMVGFPGETDEEFEQSVRTCQTAGFMKMHIFPFSPRRSTSAAQMLDQVAPQIRKQRCQRLAEVERRLARQFYDSLVGQQAEVLAERECKNQPGWLCGVDRHYAPFEFPGSTSEIGELLSVEAVEASDGCITARRTKRMTTCR
jgi:threonylcarbamoyladenosine tRNA methylthiotransferase MtaB